MIVGAAFFLLMMTRFWLTLQFVKDKHFNKIGCPERTTYSLVKSKDLSCAQS